MRKSKLITQLATASFAVIATSALVYARDADGSSGSMMGRGMMGRGMMGMTDGQHGVNRMMGHCGHMMQSNGSSGRPNEQWRDGRSAAPDENN